MMNLLKVKTSEEHGQHVKKFTVEFDISIEAWLDMLGDNPRITKSELSQILGDEMVEIIFKNWPK